MPYAPKRRETGRRKRLRVFERGCGKVIIPVRAKVKGKWVGGVKLRNEEFHNMCKSRPIICYVI
jgi:hypothetical protein